MMKAIFLGVFLFVAILAVNASEDKRGFKCTPGVNYRENKCNDCICIPRGALGCTLMSCSHQDPKLKNCRRGTSWRQGCERCWCIYLGIICTTGCGKVHDMPHY